MTERAKRLRTYLSEKLGWEVGDTHEIDPCPSCGWNCYQLERAKFCAQCGTKMPRPRLRNPTALQELEGAISYALKDKK